MTRKEQDEANDAFQEAVDELHRETGMRQEPPRRLWPRIKHWWNPPQPRHGTRTVRRADGSVGAEVWDRWPLLRRMLDPVGRFLRVHWQFAITTTLLIVGLAISLAGLATKFGW